MTSAKPDKNDPKQKQIDLDREEKLATNLPGILKWMCQGTIDYANRGPNPPQSVIDATADYRAETNDMGRFLRDMRTIPADPKLRTPLGKIYEIYKLWHEENSTSDFLQPKQFGIQMSKQGCKGRFSHGTIYYPVLIRAHTGESMSESQLPNPRSNSFTQ